MSKAPTYKISTSLINSYLYYMSQPNDFTFISLVKSVVGAFETNKWLERGQKFEEEVFQGKHDKLSRVVKGLDHQVWADNKIIKVEGLNLRISAKADAIDKLNKRIFDIKRVDKYEKEKYSSSSTSQHAFYFLMFPEIEEFYYLVAEGPGDTVKDYHVVKIKRPPQDILETQIITYISSFVNFLKENNIFELYLKAQKYIGR